MRLARMGEWLATADPAMAVRELAVLLKRTELITTLVNVHSRLSVGRVSELYEAAHELCLDDVKRLFLSGPAAKSVRDGAADNAFFEKTLGERKALAMSRDRNVIDRLMRDRHPQVIAILLNNPRLTEKDVVRIAAQQPQTVPVLEAIVHSHKWLARYAVKKALVFNPYTPRNIAISLHGALVETDRVQARRLLSERDEV